jgi:hypothetical protein
MGVNVSVTPARTATPVVDSVFQRASLGVEILVVDFVANFSLLSAMWKW